MATNRIKFWELHVEKLVVGVFGAALLGVTAWQLVGGRSTVKVGSTDGVRLEQAWERVAQEALKKKGEMESQTPPLPEEAASKLGVDILGQFERTFQGPVSPRPVLAWGGSGTGIKIAEGSGGNAVYAAPKLPSPAEPTAAVYMAAIDPSEPESIPELAPLLPAKSPMDKAWVSVETALDASVLQAAFETDPDGDGPLAALPKLWWGRSTHVLGVELVRQEQGSDGTWSDEMVVGDLPGHFSLREQIESGITPQEVPQLLADAQAFREQILRPEFYRLFMGEPWLPPTEAVAMAEAGKSTGDEVTMLKRRLVGLESNLGRIEKQLEFARSGGGDSGGGRDDLGGEGGGGRGGRGGGREGPRGTGESQPDDNSAQIKALERRLAQARQQAEGVRKQLEELGQQVAVRQPAAGAGGAASGRGTLFDEKSVRMWAHDISVERGKTYRYKVRLRMTNPLLGRDSSLPAEAKEVAKLGSLVTPDSGWSEPVRVFDDSYYFITSASDGKEPGSLAKGAQATAEMYLFKWGYWRRASVQVEPGDPIAGDVRVPDFEKIIASGAPVSGPGAGGGPSAPPTAPEEEEYDPSQREGGGRGRPGAGRPGEGREQPVDPPGAEASGGKGAAESLIPYVRIPVDAGAVLLDVVSIPGTIDPSKSGGRSPFQQAYVRSRGGTIESRSPEKDRDRDVYGYLSRSWSAGQDVLEAPKREEKERERATQPPPGRRPPEEPPASDEGGGGGGGGG